MQFQIKFLGKFGSNYDENNARLLLQKLFKNNKEKVDLFLKSTDFLLAKNVESVKAKKICDLFNGVGICLKTIISDSAEKSCTLDKSSSDSKIETSVETTFNNNQPSEISRENAEIFSAIRPNLWSATYCIILVLISSQILTIFNSVSYLIISFFWTIALSLFGCYQVTIKKVISLSMWKHDSYIGKKISNRFFWNIGCFGASLFIVPISLVAISGAKTQGAISIIMSAAISFWIFSRSCTLLDKNLKPKYAQKYQLLTAIVLPSIVVPVGINLLSFYLDDKPNMHKLSEFIKAESINYKDLSTCPLASYIGNHLSYVSGFINYTVSTLSSIPAFMLKLITSGDSLIVPVTSALAIFFSLPYREKRRIFANLTETNEGIIPPINIFWWTFLLTVFLLGIYIPLFGMLRSNLISDKTPLNATIGAVESVKKEIVEMIDGEYYKPGTIEAIKELELEMMAQTDLFKNRIDVDKNNLKYKINRMFDSKINNVDKFLDDYYSLWSEYSRIAEMVMGNIEIYMQKKLESSLLLGLDQLQSDIAQSIDSIKSLESEWEKHSKSFKEKKDKILSNNKLKASINTDNIQITQTKSYLDNSKFLFDRKINFTNKAFGASVGAGIGVMIATKIGTKIASKTLFKTAAKAAGKTALKMASGGLSGAGLGASAGAALGSVFPVVGTAIGAAVGAVTGAVVGVVAVDKILLELEDLVYRADFKKEIITEIEAQRKETLESFNLN